MRKNNFTIPRSQQEWFLHYLFNDEEFVSRKEHVLALIKERLGKNYFMTYQIFTKEPLSTYMLKSGEEIGDIVEEIKDLVMRFGISEATAVRGIGYTGSGLENNAIPMISSKDGEIIIRITPMTRKRDLLEIWDYVTELQKKYITYKPNSQANSDPKLIYAIYKQRLPGKEGKKKTFPYILKMYESNTLPLYSVDNKNGKSFLTSNDLQSYYYKYKPKSTIS